MRPDPVTSGAFAAALQNRDLPPPDGLSRPGGKPATRRFAVYRNNVAVSLVDALAAIYPTLQNLVGEEFFRAMAHAYVLHNLPTSPLLFTYGANFPAFIETFAPASALPFLPDVARVERAWLDAFHAEDRRSRLVRMTAEGSRVWRDEAPALIQNYYEQALADFSVGDTAHLLHYLLKLLDNMQAIDVRSGSAEEAPAEQPKGK